jgi:hypothetical protein
VKDMPRKITKSILPFCVLSQNRKEPLTTEIERTAVFCLAELERVKGGGLIMKQPSEKLVSVAEVCYPLWLVTMGERSLLFDGLNTTSYTLTYSAVPDIQGFLDNVNRSSATRQAYTAFLSDNVNYFQVSDIEEEKVIDGLISDLEFLDEFTSYLPEAAPVKTPLSDIIMISPTLDEASIFSVAKELQNLKSRFAEEVNSLYSSMKHVNAKTQGFMKEIHDAMGEVEKKFDKEIQKCRVSVAKKVEKIRKKHDEELTVFSREVEKELLSLQKENIKLEKTKEQLVAGIDRCEAEIKTCAVNKDSASERKWREERDKIKKQLSQAESKIKQLKKKIKAVEDKRNLKIFKLKSQCDTRTKEASKNLLEIESSRDARIRVSEEEMEKLEELTSGIIEQIDKLAKLREASIAEFDKLGVQRRKRKHALVCIPFYLACYQSEQRKRYGCFPPSTANSISFSVKFKGALGKAKIKQLLQPRFKKLVSLLNHFPSLMEQNAVFDREMNEACAKANMLRTKGLRRLIEDGLEKLKEEGWFSEKECECFSQSLT